MKYTLDQKIKCLTREVGLRRRVYPWQVRRGRIDRATAERELGLMVEILAEYQAKADALQPPLFDE